MKPNPQQIKRRRMKPEGKSIIQKNTIKRMRVKIKIKINKL